MYIYMYVCVGDGGIVYVCVRVCMYVCERFMYVYVHTLCITCALATDENITKCVTNTLLFCCAAVCICAYIGNVNQILLANLNAFLMSTYIYIGSQSTAFVSTEHRYYWYCDIGQRFKHSATWRAWAYSIGTSRHRCYTRPEWISGIFYHVFQVYDSLYYTLSYIVLSI